MTAQTKIKKPLTNLSKRKQPVKDVAGIAEALATKMPQHDPDTLELKRLVHEHAAVMRKAVAVESMTLDRIVRQGPNKGDVIANSLPGTPKARLLEVSVCLKKDSAVLEKEMKVLVKKQPIYQHFLKFVPGMSNGGVLCAYLIAYIDIRHGGRDGSTTRHGAAREYRDPIATKLSHIVRYCGYAIGRDSDGVQTGRLERRTVGVKLGYNADLRMRLFQWFSVLLKGSGRYPSIRQSKYWRLYEDTKHRLTSDPRFNLEANTWEGRVGPAKGWIHSKCWHKVVHLFLEDLYTVWRSLENLPVWPSYYAAKMGYGHNGIPMPNDSKLGAGVGPKLLALSEAQTMVGISPTEQLVEEFAEDL